MSVTLDWIRYLHQILWDNALVSGHWLIQQLVLPYTSHDHRSGNTSCCHSLNGGKLAVTTIVPISVVAVRLWEHLKNYAHHKHRTAYYVP